MYVIDDIFTHTCYAVYCCDGQLRQLQIADEVNMPVRTLASLLLYFLIILLFYSPLPSPFHHVHMLADRTGIAGPYLQCS